MKSFFKQMLKVLAFYLEKQKSFILKKIFFGHQSLNMPRPAQKMALAVLIVSEGIGNNVASKTKTSSIAPSNLKIRTCSIHSRQVQCYRALGIRSARATFFGKIFFFRRSCIKNLILQIFELPYGTVYCRLPNGLRIPRESLFFENPKRYIQIPNIFRG